MRRITTGFLLLAAVAALVAAFLVRSRVGHPVSGRMRAEADGSAGRAIRAFDGVASSGPTVVVFIQRDCPCSEAFEPYLHRLFEAYGDRAAFVGVIDGDRQEADAWMHRHRTPFRVVADPGGAIIRDFGAERSAYTALVVDGRAIGRLWPGYSAGMLRELGKRLATALGRAESPLDLEGAPETLTSGCRFDGPPA